MPYSHRHHVKIKLGAAAIVYPTSVVLCGADVKGRPNYATLGAYGALCFDPPLVHVSLTASHYTTGGIARNKTFSVNFPGTDLMAITDYCGVVSGRNADKSALFTNFYGALGTAPMIMECPVNLECRVEKDLRMHGRAIFIGRVIHVHADESCVVETNGRKGLAGIPALDPLLYALDNVYYKCGPAIGTGYSEGKKRP